MKQNITIFADGKPVAYATDVDINTENDRPTAADNGQFNMEDSCDITAQVDDKSSEALAELFAKKFDAERQIRDAFDKLNQLMPAMMIVGRGKNGELAAAAGGAGLDKALCDAFTIYDDFKFSFISLCISLINNNEQFRHCIKEVLNNNKIIQL